MNIPILMGTLVLRRVKHFVPSVKLRIEIIISRNPIGVENNLSIYGVGETKNYV
jgi:hypothetical protein